MRGRSLGILVLALVTALLAGCGIAAEAMPRPTDPPRAFVQGAPSPTAPPTDAGPITERLFLVRDDALVEVTRHVDRWPTTESLLEDLLAGPSETESTAGLTSVLSGGDVVAGVRVSNGTAVVELAATADNTQRNDEVLAYAQLVCTLTARGDVNGVTFVYRGQPIAVPRADGSLPETPETPLTAADYATLIASTTPTPRAT